MPSKFRASLALMMGLSLCLSAGCGSGNGALPPDEAQEDIRKGTLREVGEMLVLYKASKHKPPAKVADLATYEVGFQVGYLRTKEGEVVVAWGAPLKEGDSETILAHEKRAPSEGGYVLMQDGQTVKKLTADEFKSAPKAPGLEAKAS